MLYALRQKVERTPAIADDRRLMAADILLQLPVLQRRDVPLQLPGLPGYI
jgi:hypothetical protein